MMCKIVYTKKTPFSDLAADLVPERILIGICDSAPHAGPPYRTHKRVAILGGLEV